MSVPDPSLSQDELTRRAVASMLAVARSVLVDKHHGRISFETQPGKGTTFFLRLPIRASDDAMELAS